MDHSKPTPLERNLALLVACAVLPALLVIVHGGLSRRDQAIAEAHARLAGLTNNIASLQDEKSIQTRLLLKTLSALPEVRRADAPGCTALFRRLIHDDPGLFDIVLADPRGVVLASAQPLAVAADLSDDVSFREVMRSREFSAGEYLVDRLTHTPVMTFACPVDSGDGSPSRVLLLSHRLDTYGDYFRNIERSGNICCLLLDRGGVRWVALTNLAEAPPTGVPIAAGNWRIISESPSDQGRFLETRFDGTESFFHFRKLRLRPDAPPYMVVLTTLPRQDALGVANRALWTNLGLMALATLAAMLVARMLGRTLVGRQVQALRESGERFQALFEQAPEAIVLYDEDLGRFVDANANAEKLFGHDRETLLKMGPEDFYPPGQPDGLPATESILEHDRRAHSGAKVVFERLVRNAAGRHVLCEVRLSRMPDSRRSIFRASFIDITERRAMEEELRNKQALLSAIIGGTTDIVFVKDRQGRYLLVNPAFEARAGRAARDILGEDAGSVLDPAAASQAMEVDRRVMAADTACTYEQVITRGDGSPRTFLAMKGPLHDENGTVTGIFGISRDVTDLKDIEDRLRVLAYSDSLTGVNNRRRFFELASQEISRSRRYAEPLALLVMDIDHFKIVNDNHGHDAGDEGLKRFTATCLETLRETDIFGRIGGEEFGALLLNATRDKALATGERLRKAIEDLVVDVNGARFRFTVSIGLALWDSEQQSFEKLVKLADTALYQAKLLGRNRICLAPGR